MMWFKKISSDIWDDIDRAQSESAGKDIFDEYLSRDRFVKQYSWSIPTKKAINMIKTFVGSDKVLSVGSGKGLWEHLMQQAGISVTATDLSQQENPYTHVIPSNAEESVQRFRDHSVLFLNWPPYNDPMAARALSLFAGNKVIYIGEGYGGCTADNSFHDDLGNNWIAVDHACVPISSEADYDYSIEIPQWRKIHDNITLYMRKK